MAKVTTNCQSGFVKIPLMTLKALKSLLFCKEGTVDLSSIINDLSINKEDKDVVAINVGLVYNEIQPEIDKTTRYKKDYRRVYRYEFVDLSLILGTIKVKVSSICYNETTKTFSDWDGNSFDDATSLEEWLGMGTDLEEEKSAVLKNFQND